MFETGWSKSLVSRRRLFQTVLDLVLKNGSLSLIYRYYSQSVWLHHVDSPPLENVATTGPNNPLS